MRLDFDELNERLGKIDDVEQIQASLDKYESMAGLTDKQRHAVMRIHVERIGEIECEEEFGRPAEKLSELRVTKRELDGVPVKWVELKGGEVATT